MNKKIEIKMTPTTTVSQKSKKEQGSILILTIVAVLILSVMVTGLLDVGSTEVFSTQNYQLSKTAYYTAVRGVEEIRNLIYNYPDAQSVTAIKRYTTGIEGPLLYDDGIGTNITSAEGLKSSYITGTMKNMEAYYEGGYANTDDVATLGQLAGFKPPPLPSISLGGSSSIAPVIWKVNVTSEVKRGTKKAYSEIVSGIYSILTVSY